MFCASLKLIPTFSVWNQLNHFDGVFQKISQACNDLFAVAEKKAKVNPESSFVQT